jgi:hypothetical protein
VLFVVAAALGILLAPLAGGRLSALGRVRIRGEVLLLVALVVVLVVPFVGRSWPEFSAPVFWAWIAAFVVLALVATLNLDKPGFAAILLGVLLNLAVILVNTGMPVSLGGMLAAGYAGAAPPEYLGPFGLHHLAAWSTSLLLVADVTPVQGPSALRSIVSIGDVLLLVGVIVFIVWGSRPTSAVSSTRSAVAAAGKTARR